MLFLGKGDVCGVGRIGHLEVEPLVGEKITPGERWNDADNLKQGRPMLASDFNIRVHVLKELDKDTGHQRRHCRNFLSALLCNVQTNSTIRLPDGKMKIRTKKKLSKHWCATWLPLAKVKTVPPDHKNGLQLS
jgi:hypothetical protein